MKRQKSSGRILATPNDPLTRKRLAQFGLFFGVVGCGLLVSYHHGVRSIQNAERWVEVPCEISHRESKVDSADFFIPIIKYQFEFNGIAYEGRRLKLTTGNSGTDESWNYLVFDQNPVGTNTVCYVNPDDPEESVLNREYGLETPASQLFLGRLFLVVGGILSVAWVLNSPSHDPVVYTPLNPPSNLRPPPRRLGLGLTLATLLQTPQWIQAAWLCIFVLAVFFNLLKGPDVLNPLRHENFIPASGEIIAVKKDGITLNQPVFRHIFKYQWKGESLAASTYQWEEPLDIGSQIDIFIDPQEPHKALLSNQQSGEIPRWIPYLVLLMMVLPALGVIGMARLNFRTVGLMKMGVAKAADLGNEGEALLKIHAESNLFSRFQLEYSGTTYQVDSRALLANDTRNPCVLFDPANPHRNVALSSQLFALLNRQESSAWLAIRGLIFHFVCFTGLALLLFYPWFN